MNKYLLIVLCLVISIFVNAQENTKYLAGAVPEVGNKVIFSKEIKVKNPISKTALFDLMDKWAKEKYDPSRVEKDLNSRILLSNKEEGSIACGVEQYLVFKKNAFVLDRAKMSYQLLLAIEDGQCDVTIRNIRYDYSDSNDIVPAEEMITDKVALNKNGDKLNRYYDKFRTYTVDSLNAVMNEIDTYLNGTSTGGAVAAAVTVSQPADHSTTGVESATPITSMTNGVAQAANIVGTTLQSLPGYKNVPADKIPGNYIKLLNDWTLVTSGASGQENVMTASWGGLGVLWEKPVAICFLNPTRYSVQVMDKGEYYTISFYTEAYKDALKYCGSVSGRNTDKIKGSGLTPIKMPSGSTAFAEAWMILECRKIVSQQIQPNAVHAKDLEEGWTKDGFHKMYIGEILNVWIK